MRQSLLVQGRQSGQFWVRAFQLERMVEEARLELLSTAQPDTDCVMPVLIHYPQDDEFTWLCAFALFVDSVGVIDAHGMVFFCDRADFEKTKVDAQRAGQEILKALERKQVEIRRTVPFRGREQ